VRLEGISWTRFAGFDPWGTPAIARSAPAGDGGTVAWDARALLGTRLGERGNVLVTLSGAGGRGYYTRTYHRVGASSPLGGAAIALRGYRDGQAYVTGGAAATLELGLEAVPGRVHLAAFTDAAIVDAAPVVPGLPEGLRPLLSVGGTLGAVLPWQLNAQLEVAHSVLDLAGDTDTGVTIVAVRLLRSWEL
jgi:hypothetical protein